REFEMLFYDYCFYLTTNLLLLLLGVSLKKSVPTIQYVSLSALYLASFLLYTFLKNEKRNSLDIFLLKPINFPAFCQIEAPRYIVCSIDLLNKIFYNRASRRVSQFSHGFRFNLSNAFSCNLKYISNLFERINTIIFKIKTKLHNVFISCC